MTIQETEIMCVEVGMLGTLACAKTPLPRRRKPASQPQQLSLEHTETSQGSLVCKTTMAPAKPLHHTVSEGCCVWWLGLKASWWVCMCVGCVCVCVSPLGSVFSEWVVGAVRDLW